MPFKHADLWFWDSWYAKDGDTWHGYFLQAPKSLIDPDARHLNATQPPCRVERSGQLDRHGHHVRAAAQRGARARPLGRRLRGMVRGRAVARPGDARPVGDARPPRRVDDVLHHAGARRRGAERGRRDRLRHLARSRRLDAAAAGVRRRVRAARGAAGLRAGRALVLPVLHRCRALVEGGGRGRPRRAGDRHALPRGRRPARAVESGAGAVPRRGQCLAGATPRASWRPTTALRCSGSGTPRPTGASSATSAIPQR
jgi:hypothetical protein